ncbi:PAS domain-containing protein [Candidatus Saccharibacteria bacterium]|nr:PAS domain-containing protein [Candidatus Saccharibacteria bacterium]
MGIFGRSNAKSGSGAQGSLASLALNAIADGVIILDTNGKIQFMNPAALALTGYTSLGEVQDLPYTSALKFENNQGTVLADAQNPLIYAVNHNEAFSSRSMVLVSLQGKKTPVAIALTLAGTTNKILTFRNIEKELKEESEQTEFISTASHEMRTPVASIEGYLGLALNPACATIDERAQKYLTEAHNASQHLGRLFRDLLDVTKLDDQRVKVELRPVDMNALVKQFADCHQSTMAQKQIRYTFGSPDERPTDRRLSQALYSSVDVDFLKEILDNFLENAEKYTPAGGQVWVNVRGDNDRIIVNVTDTGIGIAPADIKHIFQKFYRVDNSQTRTIGGTGLGLYIAKMRAESMGGKVWAESNYGKGSTFYVSLPRLSQADYARQKQIFENTERMKIKRPTPPPANLGPTVNNAVFAATPEVLVPRVPVATPVQNQPVQPTAQPIPATQPVPAVQPAPAPTPKLAPTQPGSGNDPTTSVQDLSADKLAEIKARFAEQMKAASGSSSAT